MRFAGITCLTLILSGMSLPARAVDYSVEPLDQPAPSGELSESVAAQLSAKGFTVKKGKRTLCEIWPCKTWPVKADFKRTSSLIYPLEFGELIGVVHFARKAGDFRGQDIPKGTYTLRYALQPQDGNHIGTSDTRDFILLVPATEDQEPEAMSKEKMFSRSPQVAGGTHPTMLSLLFPGEGEAPEMVHDESRELWSLKFSNPTSAGGKQGRLTLQLVLVGRAPE